MRVRWKTKEDQKLEKERAEHEAKMSTTATKTYHGLLFTTSVVQKVKTNTL